MTTFWVTLLAIVIAVLLLIPIVIVGRTLFGIASDFREHRRTVARRIVRTLAGLGDFSTTDDRLWFGIVQGLEVSIIGEGKPPTEAQVKQLREILNQLDVLTEKAEAYCNIHAEIPSSLSGREAFELFGIDLDDRSCFSLSLSHSSDPEGWVSVYFECGEPIRRTCYH